MKVLARLLWLADAAAENDEVWSQQKLNSVQVRLHPLCPLGPTEVFRFAGPIGGIGLGGAMVGKNDVPQLRIRNERLIDEERRPDARPKRENEYEVSSTTTSPEVHLRDPGRIRIVQYDEWAPCRSAEELFDVRPDPGVVDVAGGLCDAVLDSRRKCGAYGTLPRKMSRNRTDYLSYGLRSGRLGRRNAVSFFNECSRRRVDWSALDSRSSYVNTEYNHRLSEFRCTARSLTRSACCRNGMKTAADGKRRFLTFGNARGSRYHVVSQDT